ncbi:MarR family transcriptional regulator [Streptomonospora sp. PA3]|nr:MarR family transcriptional regulator [Streptomonospora sp. PA3]
MWSRLVALHSQVDSVVERALHRQFGIGLSEFLALASCAAAPDGEMRMQDLTEAVYLNQSSVSRMVNRLERTGLTERRICEHDRRGVYTGITEHGLAVFRDAVPVYESALRQGLDRSAADPRLAPLVEQLNATRDEM